MNTTVLIVEPRDGMPKIQGRGRKPGFGSNLNLLKRLKVGGDPVFDVPRNKMHSIRQSANLAGIPIKIRAIPDSDLYAIQRI